LDAAIIDVSLGKETSYPVADALLERSIPFAFATGHGESAIDARFKAPFVLAKPFSFEGLREMLIRFNLTNDIRECTTVPSSG
jgi:hypothetical protein